MRCLVCPALVLGVVLATGCGNSSSGGGVVPELSSLIVYSKTRDTSNPPAVVPILSESGSGFDASEVDSPAVADDPARPDRFLLYYEATDGGGALSIGVVTADEEDFATLTVGRTQAIAPMMATDFDFAASDPSVLVDKRSAENPPAASPSRRYKMWFEGRTGSLAGPSTIIFATSADGISWTGFTSCTGLDPGTDVSFAVRVADPTVVLDRDPMNPADVYEMWFEAVAADGTAQIGYADSADGVAWTVRDGGGNTGAAAGAVFGASLGTGFDSFTVEAPNVVLEADDSDNPIIYHLWYEAGILLNVDMGGNDVENSIGYATSLDGLNWTRDTLPVLRPSSDSAVPLPFDSGDLKQPSALIDRTLPATTDGHFLLWYAGDGENGANPNRIGFAAGRAGP